ncbi:MAG: hypothetical protein ACOCSN_06495, partial [Halanaeroarchaeum sp.]
MHSRLASADKEVAITASLSRAGEIGGGRARSGEVGRGQTGSARRTAASTSYQSGSARAGDSPLRN